MGANEFAAVRAPTFAARRAGRTQQADPDRRASEETPQASHVRAGVADA